MIIDYIMLFVVSFGGALFVMAAGGEAGVRFVELGNSYVFGLLMAVAYYFVMEAVFSKTVGKLITGTKVVNETGGRPSIGQFLGRSFTRMVPFEAFSFLGDSCRGWHDRWPNTYVIRTRG